MAIHALINIAYVLAALSIAAISGALVGYICELVLKVRKTDNKNWLLIGNTFVACSIPAVLLTSWFIDGKNLSATNIDVILTIVASAAIAPVVAALFYSVKEILRRTFVFADSRFVTSRSK